MRPRRSASKFRQDNREEVIGRAPGRWSVAVIGRRVGVYQSPVSGPPAPFRIRRDTGVRDADLQEWERAAVAEPWSMAAADALYL
jgi:hypothetical protein